MRAHPIPAAQNRRIVAGLPFVEALARRMAASMPNTIDLGDLMQDGVLGLIDAAHRFDEARGIKFETFAERRVRGAMIDALRRDAWPRGVRRQRRELDAARESLRRELGHEPSMADLAARVGSDEKRLSRTDAESSPGAGSAWSDRAVLALRKNGNVQKYAVVIHEDPEGGFWAEVPALPGCYSQGETVAELMDNIREAITGVLEVMQEQGSQPEPNIQILDVAV